MTSFMVFLQLITKHNCDAMHEINITKEGITRLLKNLASSKASGTDMISAGFLKETADEVANGLIFLMNGEKR